MACSRRSLLAAGATGVGALYAKTALAVAMPAPAGNTPTLFLSAATTTGGQHCAVGFDAAGVERLRVPLPTRGHQMTIAPGGARLFATPRRPGTTALVVDLATQQVAATCESAPGRHFFGHAVYSQDGQHLLTTENDYENRRGVVAVREARTLKVVAEIDSGGIGPHELAWLPDGRTLAVANGGIVTHPSQPREKRNLGTMRPNLSILDVASGELQDQAPALHSQASLRHLTVADAGEVLVAMQYEGPPGDDVPLMAVYRGQGVLEPLQAPLARQRKMKQYVASVAADPATGHAVATCPRANLITFWNSRTGRYLGERRFPDAGGVAFDAATRTFAATNGRGTVVRLDAHTFALRESVTRHFVGLKWDNHLTAANAA